MKLTHAMIGEAFRNFLPCGGRGCCGDINDCVSCRANFSNRLITLLANGGAEVAAALTIEQVIAACRAVGREPEGLGVRVPQDGGRWSARCAGAYAEGDTADAAIQQLGRNAVEVLREQRNAADRALRALGVEP